MATTDIIALAALHAAADTLARFRGRIPRPVLDEIAQEAALRSWSAAAVRDPRAFASRIARNLAIDWIRRAREVSLGDWDGGASAVWDPRLDARLDAQRIRTLLAIAPSAYRATLRALYLDEDTVEQLVERTSPGADPRGRARARDLVYKRRGRALAWMRARLEPRAAA